MTSLLASAVLVDAIKTDNLEYCKSNNHVYNDNEDLMFVIKLCIDYDSVNVFEHIIDQYVCGYDTVLKIRDHIMQNKVVEENKIPKIVSSVKKLNYPTSKLIYNIILVLIRDTENERKKHEQNITSESSNQSVNGKQEHKEKEAHSRKKYDEAKVISFFDKEMKVGDLIKNLQSTGLLKVAPSSVNLILKTEENTFEYFRDRFIKLVRENNKIVMYGSFVRDYIVDYINGSKLKNNPTHIDLWIKSVKRVEVEFVEYMIQQMINQQFKVVCTSETEEKNKEKTLYKYKIIDTETNKTLFTFTLYKSLIRHPYMFNVDGLMYNGTSISTGCCCGNKHLRVGIDNIYEDIKSRRAYMFPKYSDLYEKEDKQVVEIVDIMTDDGWQITKIKLVHVYEDI